MTATSDLQIKAAHKKAIDALWAKQRCAMNDALFLNHVLREAEDGWDMQHGDESHVIAYAKALTAERWTNIRPKLRKEVEVFFTVWLATALKEYERFEFIPNKQLSRLMDEAEGVYRIELYQLDVVHPDEWNMVRSWLWERGRRGETVPKQHTGSWKRHALRGSAWL